MMYIDIEYADDYIGTNFFVRDQWIALSEPDKETLIKGAFNILEGQIWIGEKVEPVTQNEQFPRDIRDYFELDTFKSLPDEIKTILIFSNTIIPEEIKKAQAELIIYYLQAGGNQSLIDLEKIDVKSFEIGDLKFTFDDKSSAKHPLPEIAWHYAKWWHLHFWQTINKSITFVRG